MKILDIFIRKFKGKIYLSFEFECLSLQLPLLDHAALGSEEDWARAYLVLSAIGNGYVWQNGEDDPVKVWEMSYMIPCESFKLLHSLFSFPNREYSLHVL